MTKSSKNYAFFCLKGYKNQKPRKHQMKCWSVDCLQPIPYASEQMILGGLSDCWFAVFAHANSNKAPTLSWPESGSVNKLVLKSINTAAPEKSLFSTVAIALAHNRERKLTEFHRLKDHAISVDGLPWNKEILRTFLFFLSHYQRIIWTYPNPCDALKSVDLVGFINLVAKGTAKRIYTETFKQILLHLLILQDTRITVRRIGKRKNKQNAIVGDLNSSQILRIVSRVDSDKASELLCELLDNPTDDGIKDRIRWAGLKINLLDSAIDKVQSIAFVGFKHKFTGGKTPLYKAQIFTMPVPINIKKMDEYRLFAFLSAYTNMKNKEFEPRAFNFKTLAAIVGKLAAVEHEKPMRFFSIAKKVLPIFCTIWGYDGAALSFLMERSSDQDFDYKAVCQTKRAQALAEFAAENNIANPSQEGD